VVEESVGECSHGVKCRLICKSCQYGGLRIVARGASPKSFWRALIYAL
jgi:hypothetical protein